MNWVGGARSRIKMKVDHKKQREFFKKRRLENANNARNSESYITPTLSRDLLTFNLLQIKSRKVLKEAKPTKVLKQNLEKFNAGKTLHVNIPETPIDKVKCCSERREDGECFKRRRTEPEKNICSVVSDNNDSRKFLNSSKTPDILHTFRRFSEMDINYRNANNLMSSHTRSNVSHKSIDFNDQQEYVYQNQEESVKTNYDNVHSNGDLKKFDNEYIKNNNICELSDFKNDRSRKNKFSVFSSFSKHDRDLEKSAREFPKKNMNMYSKEPFEFCPNFNSNSMQSSKHFRGRFCKESFLVNENGTTHPYDMQKRYELENVDENDTERHIIENNIYAQNLNDENFSLDSDSSSPTQTNSSYVYQHSGRSKNLAPSNLSENIEIIRNINEQRSILKTAKNIICDNSRHKECSSVFDSTSLDTYKEENDMDNISFGTPMINLSGGGTNEDLDDYSVFQETISLTKKSKHLRKQNIFSRGSYPIESQVKRSENMHFENDRTNYSLQNASKHNHFLHRYMQGKESTLDYSNIPNSNYSVLQNLFSKEMVKYMNNNKRKRDVGTNPMEIFEKCKTNEEFIMEVPNNNKHSYMDACQPPNFNDGSKSTLFYADDKNFTNDYGHKFNLNDPQEKFSNNSLKVLSHTSSSENTPVDYKNKSHENMDFIFSKPVSYSMPQSVSNTPENLPRDNEEYSDSRSMSNGLSKMDCNLITASNADNINCRERQELNKSIQKDKSSTAISEIKEITVLKNTSDIVHAKRNVNKNDVNDNGNDSSTNITCEDFSQIEAIISDEKCKNNMNLPHKEIADKKNTHFQIERMQNNTDDINSPRRNASKKNNKNVVCITCSQLSPFRLPQVVQAEDDNFAYKNELNVIMEHETLLKTEENKTALDYLKTTEVFSSVPEVKEELNLYKLKSDGNSHDQTEKFSKTEINLSSQFKLESNVLGNIHSVINQPSQNFSISTQSNVVCATEGISEQKTLLDASKDLENEDAGKNISFETFKSNYTCTKVTKDEFHAVNTDDKGTQTCNGKTVNTETQTSVERSDFFCQVSF